METYTFYCPKCGRELTVPSDTNAFYCTYCAAPLQTENGTLHAGLTGSEPHRRKQNPFRPNAKCIRLYLLSIAAAVVIPIIVNALFSSKTAVSRHTLTLPTLMITMLVAGILLARTFPFRERKRPDFLGRIALALTIWLLELFLADFFFRLTLFTAFC